VPTEKKNGLQGKIKRLTMDENELKKIREEIRENDKTENIGAS